jgi:hypothetical protein
VLQGDPRAFLGALEAAIETNHTSAVQLNVLNRQSARLKLDDRIGFEGSIAQGATATILSLRPIVVAGGFVHLDVRREGELDEAASGGRPEALTHQIVVREGQTAVVGGFYAEHLAADLGSAPGIDKAPLAGRTSRRKSGAIERSETIVILTPHVIHPKSAEGGQTRRGEASHSAGRERPLVQQAAASRSNKSQGPHTVATKESIRTSREQPAVRAAVIPAVAEEPPRRLPSEGTASARLMTHEARDKNQPPDSDMIPILELPGDEEPRPTIRPARGKAEP